MKYKKHIAIGFVFSFIMSSTTFKAQDVVPYYALPKTVIKLNNNGEYEVLAGKLLSKPTKTDVTINPNDVINYIDDGSVGHVYQPYNVKQAFNKTLMQYLYADIPYFNINLQDSIQFDVKLEDKVFFRNLSKSSMNIFVKNVQKNNELKHEIITEKTYLDKKIGTLYTVGSNNTNAIRLMKKTSDVKTVVPENDVLKGDVYYETEN